MSNSRLALLCPLKYPNTIYVAVLPPEASGLCLTITRLAKTVGHRCFGGSGNCGTSRENCARPQPCGTLKIARPLFFYFTQ